jgi:hypothetical protein
MSYFNKLKDCLSTGEVKQCAYLMSEIYKKYEDSWLDSIKRSNVLPNPLSNEFSNEIFITFLKALEVLYKEFHYEQIKKALELFYSIIKLYDKIQKINKVISNSSFYSYLPEKQIQLLCVYLEDQARLTFEKYQEQKNNNKISSAVDLINFNIYDAVTNRSVPAAVNIESIGDAVDLNLNHIFNKYNQALKGNYKLDLFPYEEKSLIELLYLANIRQNISDIWQKIKYRNWSFSIKDDYTYFLPPDKNRYLKQEAARNRYNLYIMELVTGFLFNYPDNEKFFESIVSKLEITTHEKFWKINIPSILLRKLLVLPTTFDAIASELHFEFYKGSLKEITLGPEDMKINGEEFLKTCKYIYILSRIYEYHQRLNFAEEESSRYYTLVPIIKERNLIHKFMEITGCSRKKSENSLKLFYYNIKNKKIDIWFQPLVPLGKGNLILIPCIGKNIDVIRLFESHFSQWKITFRDRGPIFEESIRNKLKKLNIPVVPHSIKFNASDGKEVQYDVVSWFKNYLILIEAKCLRIPHSAVDLYYCWNETLKGVEQLKRRKNLIKTDWKKFKNTDTINLPQMPPKKEKIYCILVTNIFNFTGCEIDGIRITDFTCLRRYFDEPEIKCKSLSQDGVKTEEIVERIWQDDEPSPEEFWEFIKNPPNLRNILNRIKMKFSPIPPVTKEDKNVFCVPYTILE